MIVNVLPCLEDLREGLIAARDDEEHDVSNIIRVACQAAILVIDKYSLYVDSCDLYIFAIGNISLFLSELWLLI